METRTLFSTWTVTSLADDGSSGTLRSVISAAEASSGDQTVQFDPSLTSAGPATIALNASALEVSSTSGTLTIEGPSSGYGITIDGQSESGVFAVDATATVVLSNLTLTNGSDGVGGGIVNAGNLTTNNVTVTVNSAEWYGGGVDNTGTLTMNDSTISGSTLGGGIDNFTTAIINSCTITGNSGLTDSNDYAGGVTNFGTMTISGSTITNNASDMVGGGISTWGTLTVTDTTISGNTGYHAGGIFIAGGSTTTITDCTIIGNTGTDTGAVYTIATTNISDCTITGNTALGTSNNIFSSGTASITGSTVDSQITTSGMLIASGLVPATSGTFAIEVQNGGTLQLPSSMEIPSLTIDAGGIAKQTSTDTTFGSEVLTVGSLTINNPSGSTNGGVLDLGNSDMIIEPGITLDGESGGGGTSSPSPIFTLLAAGFDGGMWDGAAASGPNPAAIISTGAANDPYQIEALGYAQIGSDPGDLSLSTFDGKTVSTGDTVVALTYYGDANLDRSVDSTDYAMIGATYPYIGTQIGGWTGGDFNYDGSIDSNDTTLYEQTVAFLADPPTTAPSTEIHIDVGSDIIDKPAAGAQPNAEKYTVHVTATSDGHAANVPKWKVSVTNSDGSKVAPGTITFTQSHDTGGTGSNEFQVYASADTPVGTYVITVTGPGGQTVTMNIVVTDHNP